MKRWGSCALSGTLVMGVLAVGATTSAAATPSPPAVSPPDLPAQFVAPMPAPQSASISLPPPAATASGPGALLPTDVHTAYSHTFTRPDGKRERRVYAQPVYYQSSDGSWHDIDLSLVPTALGDYQAKAANPDAPTFSSHLAGGARANTTAGPVVMTHVAGLSDPPAAADGPQTVRYRGALPGGRDVSEVMGRTGFEEVVTVPSASPANAVYQNIFAVPPGVSAKAFNGGVEFLDTAGQPVAYFHNGMAHDAATPAAQARVEVTLDSQVATQVTVSGGHRSDLAGRGADLPGHRRPLRLVQLHDVVGRQPVRAVQHLRGRLHQQRHAVWGRLQLQQ